MTKAPTEDLIRAVFGRAKAADDGRLMVGHAAVFNTWTEIASLFEGNFLERLAPGAFRKTLSERADKVKVLFNHGMDPSIGDKPLGRPREMREDKVGLYTETPLDETSYNTDLLASLRSGALDGMSFRFSVTREEWDEDPEPSADNPRGIPERTILELKLYEFGPVTFPAYEATTVGVRSRDSLTRWLSASRDERATILNALSDAADTRTSEDIGRTADTGIRLDPSPFRVMSAPRLAELRAMVLTEVTP